jgi:hypothetical protein
MSYSYYWLRPSLSFPLPPNPLLISLLPVLWPSPLHLRKPPFDSFSSHTAREYWMIYRWPGFPTVDWLGSYPTPSPLIPSVSSNGDTQEDWGRETTYWRERGRSQIIRPQESLVLYKSFNYLCIQRILSSNFMLSAIEKIPKLNLYEQNSDDRVQ